MRLIVVGVGSAAHRQNEPPTQHRDVLHILEQLIFKTFNHIIDKSDNSDRTSIWMYGAGNASATLIDCTGLSP